MNYCDYCGASNSVPHSATVSEERYCSKCRENQDIMILIRIHEIIGAPSHVEREIEQLNEQISKLQAEADKLKQYVIKNKWYEPENETPVTTIMRIVANFIAQNRTYDEEIKYLKLELDKVK